MTATLPKLAWSDFEKRLGAASRKDHLPLAGAFELTYRCNFSCIHCFQQDCRKQEEISGERWCQLVDEVARAGTLWLTLTGGEPFLHPGFDAVYERAVRAGLLVTVFSNGSSLTAERIAWLSRLPPRTIEVTLYGFSPKTYARVTGRAENFELAVGGVRRAVAAGLFVQVKTVVFDETVEDFEALKAFAAELGQAFRFDTLLHGTLGRSAAPGSHRLSPDAVAALEAATLGPTASSRPSACEPVDGGKVFRCGAGRHAYSVAPDGALQLCPLLRSLRVDLAQRPFVEAWEQLGHAVERPYSSRSRCAKCSLRPTCNTCPGIASIERGDEEAEVDHLCETARLRAGAAKNEV